MKKLLIALSALVLVFTLSGCDLFGGGGEDLPDLSALTITGVVDVEVLVGAEVNLLTGITAGGDDDLDYSSYITVDSPTCTIAADGTLETTVPLNCIVTYTVLAFGVLKTIQAEVTINPVPITWDGGPELISWDFSDDSDLDGWEIYVAEGGALEISIEDGAMKMVTESSSVRYGTRLDFQGIPMEEDYDYRITFRMKSSVPDKAVHVNYGELIGGAPYFYPFKAEGFDVITVGTEWAEYEIIFNMSGQDAAANLNRGALVLEMGNNEGFLTDLDATIWVDDIKIEGGSGVDGAPPILSGIQNEILDRNATFDPLAGITANDLTDGDLTSAIVVTGDTVDTAVDGDYTITYTVTDAAGNVATMDRVITVVGLVIDTNNAAVNDIFAANGPISTELTAAWYASVSWGEPIFTAEIIDGQMVIVSQKDGDKAYGTNPWDHIVRYTDMSFIKDVEYKVEFDAKTSVTGNTDENMMFKIEGTGFASEVRLAVTDTFATYSHAFTWTPETTTNGSILFFVGGLEHTITIENIKIYISVAGADVENAPVISGAMDQTVSGGAEVDLLEGVTASDIEDGAVDVVVTVLGPNAETEFDGAPGVWTITYTATDADSNETVVTAELTVLEGYSFIDTEWVAWYGDEWSGPTTSVVSLEDGELVVDVIYEGTPQSYATQVYQENFAVENGKTYRISFDARADEAKSIMVAFGDALDADPWFTDFVTKTQFDLTTEMVTYTLEVTMTEPTTADQGKLVFELATAVNTKVYIDNVKIEETTAVDGDVVADTNQVLDGTFEDTAVLFEDTPWVSWLGDEWSGPTTSVVLISKGELVVDVIFEGTPQTYATQVYQENFAVENGKTYRITFDAKAGEAKAIMVAFGDALDSDPWFTDFVAKTQFDLTTEMVTYTLDFLMEQPTTADQGKLVFELATAVNTMVYIDNVKIEETTAIDGDVVADTDQVLTGDFETVADVVVVPEPVWTGFNMTVVEGDLGPNDVTITYDNVSDPWWNDNAQHSNIVFDGNNDAIEFTFTGTDGALLVFKVEGWGGNVEGRMTADGTEQTFLLDLSSLTKEQRDQISLMIIFVETVGAAGSLALSYEAVMPELDPAWEGFGGTTVVDNGDGSVDITYDVTTEWWWDFSAQHLNLTFDGTTFNAIDFTFTGVDTHNYKFKIEYAGGAKETGDGVVGNGAEQVVTLDLSTFTPEQLSSINKVVIFSSGQGQTGTVTVAYALTTVAVDTSTMADMPNQDFTDADISGWGTEGTLTLAHDNTNGYMVVTVTELGANPWDQNIGFPSQNLVAGNTYEVTYVIKTAFAEGRDVTFFVENVDAGYAKYFEETETLTDSFQTFTYTFTPDANNDDTKLGIFFGNTSNPLIGDVIIDSITITETVPAS
ncbi:carbohydrate binding domain-containing protein [Candidatus Izimaplasma bacterium]|nr:carbohydrate binding domain-containing protein [Candidatus Izimaplasma bacterium]